MFMPKRPPRHAAHPPTPRQDARPSSAQRGYDRRWRALRLVHLTAHPFCATCWVNGVPVPATVVDHVIPHKGDPLLLYDAGNLQSLCAPCHDRKTGGGQ